MIKNINKIRYSFCGAVNICVSTPWKGKEIFSFVFPKYCHSINCMHFFINIYIYIYLQVYNI